MVVEEVTVHRLSDLLLCTLLSLSLYNGGEDEDYV